MPVAIKLSKRFYDTFGQEVTNELVDALNAVDTSYRDEFRDLFAANFGTVRAELATVRAEMVALENKLEGRMNAFEHEVRGELKGMKSELLAWMVGLWLASGALALLVRAWGS